MNYFKLTLFGIFLIIIEPNCFSQNLIANGSFEDANTCSEHNAKCAPEAWKTTSPFLPIYGGKENRSVSIVVFNTSVLNTRMYLQTKLLCPLIKDKKYHFSLKVKPGTAQLESIGALFSDSVIFNNKDVLIKAEPSIDLGTQILRVPKKKRTDWNELSIDYTAKGFEKYLIIGNFQSDDEQKRTFYDKPKVFANYYYELDDIELLPIDSIEVCPDYEITREKLYSLNDRHPLTRSNLFYDERTLDSIKLVFNPTLDTIRLSNVLFEFDSYILNRSGVHVLDSIISTINKDNIEIIKIHGHTDSIGPEDYNLKLSLDRANSVSKYLASQNLLEYIVEIKGLGDKSPIEDNTNEIGRQKNRRVEIIIKYKDISR